MKCAIMIAAIVSLFAFTNAASAHSTTHRYYIDGLAVGNSIESQGFSYNGRHVNVDNAYCSGLRRYGVQSSEYGLDKFWRFKCDATGADGHWYTLQVSTTSGSIRSYWYWHILNTHRDF